MAINTPENPLLVFEYGGKGRSGKGTIVNSLLDIAPSIASEETGADYRGVTYTLLEQGEIEVGMTEEAITQAVGKVGLSGLADMVAQRPSIVAAHGNDVLYADAVRSMVGLVSPILMVRKAVKEGFKLRIQGVINDVSKKVLLVDGRNLAPVIDEVPGTALVMRTFVDTLSYEGALRELDRNPALNDAPLSHRQDYFRTAMQQLEDRNKQDANRKEDRVMPDANAIDYWWEQPLLSQNAQRYADLYYDGRELDALIAISDRSEAPRLLRHGVRSLAVQSGRQIFFDTTLYRQQYPANPVYHMLEAARLMFNEGLQSYQRRVRIGLMASRNAF